jgi:hypothetical protein
VTKFATFSLNAAVKKAPSSLSPPFAMQYANVGDTIVQCALIARPSDIRYDFLSRF